MKNNGKLTFSIILIVIIVVAGISFPAARDLDISTGTLAIPMFIGGITVAMIALYCIFVRPLRLSMLIIAAGINVIAWHDVAGEVAQNNGLPPTPIALAVTMIGVAIIAVGANHAINNETAL